MPLYRSLNDKKNMQVRNILLLVLISLGSKLIAQSETSFFNSIKTGDIQSLEAYLTDQVDFCIIEDQQTLSRKAAIAKFKNFLANQNISSLEVIHKGVSKDKTSQYKVVKLVTNKGAYRLFVYGSGDFKAGTIKEIRIDKF
jgi:hypothetical protein